MATSAVLTSASAPGTSAGVAVDQLVRDVLSHGDPLDPTELHAAVAEIAGSGSAPAVTFADVRRAIWRLIGLGEAEFTSDWRVYLTH